MASPGSSGRRRVTTRTYSQEDQALNQIAREAENRLAARRAARAEARDIRMKELDKQAQDAEDKQDRHYELTKTSVLSRTYARHESEETSSNEDTRELRKEVNELDEKYKKAMMSNAQLDNEKQTYRYQVEILKDQYADIEEELLELQRIHKDRCRELEAQKRDYKDLQMESTFYKEQMEQRDTLIAEYGLVFMSNETVEPEPEEEEGGRRRRKKKKKDKEKEKEKEKPALVTPEAAEILKRVEGNLDDRIKIFSNEKRTLDDEIRKLKQALEEEKERSALAEKYASPKPQVKVNGPDIELQEAQMEAQRQISEYKFKLKKAEQDITQLEGNVIRLESQVKRYKSSSENSEKQEEELKAEKRKLQRELRESQSTIEELQTSNNHLQKRIEKIKSSRNALAKT